MPMRNSIRRSSGRPGVALGLRPLQLDRTTQGIHDALELDRPPVAHGLDQPAAMAGDRRLKHLAQVVLKSRARPFLVGLAQTPIAGDVGDEDSGKPALHQHLSQSPKAFFRREM